MSRLSGDQLTVDGTILNGFDYRLQVWVKDGTVQMCGHPVSMRLGARVCCNQTRYAGQLVETIEGHEVRS